MITKNAQNETPSTRGTEESSYHELDGNQCTGTGFTGREDEGEPITAHRTDRKRTNSFSESGGNLPGGMVEQFISDIQDDLKDCAERSEKLQKRLEDLQKISAQIKKKGDRLRLLSQ